MIICDENAKRYLREIRGALVCSPKIKRRIISEIKESVLAFLAEVPDADYNCITARFGTPQQIAATYVDEMESTEILSSLQIRKRIIAIVMVGMIAIVTVWLSVVGSEYMKYMDNTNGYFDIAIEVLEETIYQEE